MNTINFANETVESLNNQGITSMDFCHQFAGTPIQATLIMRLDGYGQAIQDGSIYNLDGDCQSCALLSNGVTVYSEDITELLASVV